MTTGNIEWAPEVRGGQNLGVVLTDDQLKRILQMMFGECLPLRLSGDREANFIKLKAAAHVVAVFTGCDGRDNPFKMLADALEDNEAIVIREDIF